MIKNTIVNLPQNFKIVVWKNKKINIFYIFVYNNNKKISFWVTIHKNNLLVDTNTNSIYIKKNNLSNNNVKLINKIKFFLYSWDVYFFKKIKFKGKGFRMRFLKKNKFVKFFFGRSHKTFILFKKIIMKKINKYKFILKHLKYENLVKNANIVTKIKPLNIYTLRGLRKTRQIIFKRKGKKSTYI